MKSVLKILAWLVGLVFVLVIVAALVLPMMIDPNDYRDQIGDAVRKQTGRELVIEGELNLSVVPWLGVEVGRASLSNAPGLGDEPMLAIDGASVGVRLMPLLSRRLEVSEIKLDGLRLNLYQGTEGTNWDDLAGAEETPAEPAAEAGPGFDMSEVGGITLRDARVRFVDEAAGSDMEATIGEFSTGRITARGEAFNIDGISLDNAGVSYSDKETGVLKASLGSLSTGAVMADPDSPDVSDLRLGNAAVELIDQVEDLGIAYSEGWGMSETTSLGIANPVMGLKKPGSIGIPFPSMDVKLVDLDNGKKEVPQGEPGELLIKGPLVMKEYWENPEKTAETLKDGWLHTGDIAKMDDEGYFYIVDRKKDMIIAGGYNIYPRDIDEVLYQHPKVLDAVSVGIPHEYRGETVKAFVVLQPGETASAEEIIDFCKTKLAIYKVPKIVEFRDDLPKSAVGKILRKILRDEEVAKGETA